MASPRRKATISARAVGRKKAHSSSVSSTSKSRVKKTRPHTEVKYRGAPISRARLRSIRDGLQGTRNVVSELHENFWVTSEQQIREMLALTQQKIDRAVGVLEKAA